jgi:hypothetical protein
MKQTSVLITVCAALLVACGNDGTRPGDEPLRLDATIGRSTIGFGDTTSIVFRLRNLSSDSIVLSFLSSCQVLPYITTPRADEVVYPSAGAWGCYAVLTNLVLGPGAEHVTTVLVHGGPQVTYPAIPLLPGEYRAYARLEHADFPLRSATITFRVD